MAYYSGLRKDGAGPSASSGLQHLQACDIFHKLVASTLSVPSLSHPMASETSLRPGEIKDILLREIEAADLQGLDVEEVGTVLEVISSISPAIAFCRP